MAVTIPVRHFFNDLCRVRSCVAVAGRDVFDPRVARELLEKMKVDRVVVSQKGRFEDDLSSARVLEVDDDGISAVERRLDAKDR